MEKLIPVKIAEYGNSKESSKVIFKYRKPLYKNNNMKLIYIRSAMEPKNYSSIRAILKQEQGEKVAPYVFKVNDTKKMAEYLEKEQIIYETYVEEKVIKEIQEKNKERKNIKELINSLDRARIKYLVINN